MVWEVLEGGFVTEFIFAFDYKIQEVFRMSSKRQGSGMIRQNHFPEFLFQHLPYTVGHVHVHLVHPEGENVATPYQLIHNILKYFRMQESHINGLVLGVGVASLNIT